MTKIFIFLFFRENKAWYFMWIVYLADEADDSQEKSSIIFSEK